MSTSNKNKNLTINAEIADAFRELKSEYENKSDYPFELTNSQFFRVMMREFSEKKGLSFMALKMSGQRQQMDLNNF